MKVKSQLNQIKTKARYTLTNNLLWLGLLIFSLILPIIISADVSMRIVLLLAFLAIFSKYQARIILIYLFLYMLLHLSTNSFELPEYAATQIYIYLFIYLLVLILEPIIDSLQKKQEP